MIAFVIFLFHNYEIIVPLIENISVKVMNVCAVIRRHLPFTLEALPYSCAYSVFFFVWRALASDFVQSFVVGVHIAIKPEFVVPFQRNRCLVIGQIPHVLNKLCM